MKIVKEENKAVVETSGRGAQPIRKIIGWLKCALRQNSYENKDEYKRLFLAADISQAKIVIVLFAAIIVLFILSDYMFFNLSVVFYELVALRLVLLAYCVWQFMFIGKVENYCSYDRSTLLYLLTISVGILIVNSTRPENFLPHIIVIDTAVFVYYLVIPNRFIYQAIPALVFTLGEVAILMLTFEVFEMPALFIALLSLAFTNVVGALGALQLHSYRRRILENVTERKETERLAAIGQTASMIGHDIRNPLQAIVSELYLAKDVITSGSHPEEEKKPALESINIIQEQTDYISKIVSDLQDYARPITPEFSNVDLSELIVSVFQTISLPDEIVLKIDVKGFPKIETDPTLIRRALTNLINNAIQAMPDGGTLGLTAVKTKEYIIIKISDTGKGIPEEIKPKLFTPLVTSKAKGQGLGLAVVKRLVEALGGSITFESQLDKGTTFTIRLPVKD
ncbi:MAG: ATP-binding protein [Candidatus Bathyarchaeota archaeon]|nr:ATP-binding protein [Candidatus Bathyarchaeota archaeon]